MQTRPYDIYGTQHKVRAPVEPLTADAVQAAQNVLDREIRRGRRISIVLALVVIAFGGLIATVAFRQYMHSLTPAPPAAPAPPFGAAHPSVYLEPASFDIEIPPQATMLMDDIVGLGEIPVPQNGDAPFNAQWVKQAAHYVVLGEQAYRDNRLEDALENYRTALKIFPALGGVHRHMGLIYLQLKDYRSAAEAFDRAATEEETSFGILNNLGVAYLALQDYDKAEAYFQRALNLRPSYTPAQLNLATLCLRAGRKEEACQYFSEYLANKPDDIKVSQTYAQTLMDLRRWQEAILVLEQIRRSAPEAAPVYFHLAEALAHVENPEGAVSVLRHGSSLVDSRKALVWLSGPEFDLLRSHPDFQILISSLGSERK